MYVSVRTDLSLMCPHVNTLSDSFLVGTQASTGAEERYGGSMTVCKNGKQACVQEAITSCSEEMKFVLLAFRSGEAHYGPREKFGPSSK